MICETCGDCKLSTQDAKFPIVGHSKNVDNNPNLTTLLGLESLLDTGFSKVGQWLLEGSELRLQLEKRADMTPALYAFVSNLDVLYIGKTSRKLKQRLYHYARPGPTQSTNIRLHSKLRAALEKSENVHIYAFGDVESLCRGPFKMDIPAALEDDIIRKLKPKWNKRGSP